MPADTETMEVTIRQAQKHNIAIGAHPGYPDRENFGRLELKLSFVKLWILFSRK